MGDRKKLAKPLSAKPWAKDKLRVIGLMSGTSRDGMDAALITSDGAENITCNAAITIPYAPLFAEKLAELCELGEKALTPEAQALIAPVEVQLNLYAQLAVSALLEGEGRSAAENIDANIDAKVDAKIDAKIDALAFHGHTIYHAPNIAKTLQIGDAKKLAENTNITVVSDFRSRDMKFGGHGAPLAPLYHLAIAKYLRASNPSMTTSLALPIVFLNIGGIANVTWIDSNAEVDKAEVDKAEINKAEVDKAEIDKAEVDKAEPELDANMLAFDTGPGNALLDDWVAKHSRLAPAGTPLAELAFDKDGAFARSGKCNEKILEKLMQEPFFAQKPPKSLDRKQFSIKLLEGLSLEDGAKTLTVFLAQTIRKASEFFPNHQEIKAVLWILCGGGRKNLAIVESLQQTLSARVQNIDELGFDGDALEAQAFAYLAIRRLKGMPTAYPQLTGASIATSGGEIHTSAGSSKNRGKAST